MTTYSTYQEAKIANPECEIFHVNGICFFNYEALASDICNPSDYCMTVEKFFADGHKFVDGDICLGQNDNFLVISGSRLINGWNDESQIIDGIDRYVLRAAALKEKKPRTKVEYLKVNGNYNEGAFWECARDYSEGVIFTTMGSSEQLVVDSIDELLDRYKCNNLYRRIETPMTWKEELYDYLDNSCEMSDDFDDSFTIEIEGRPLEFNLNDDEFVDMCKLVASLNSVN
jgi:hypothetical protein